MQIKELHSKEEIFKTFEVIAQIYGNLEEVNYVETISNMMKENYKIAGVFESENQNQRCIGAVGIKIVQKLQYGKVIEIEDFVVDKKENIEIGKILIKWVELQAANLGCDKIICTIDSNKIESHKILSCEGFLLEGFKFLK